MSNLDIYNSVRSVPQEAQKKITGGRLNGKTDISPMWRIKTLTERFGPCGTGWRYEITDKRLEHGANGEIAAFVDINLYYRLGPSNVWSDAIPGTGGSMFVVAEKSGLYTSDECYKMALTDALSVACKALGVGADIYWQADASKYAEPPTTQPDWVGRAKDAGLRTGADDVITPAQRSALTGMCGTNTAVLTEIRKNMGYEKTSQIRQSDYAEVERRLKAALEGKA